MVGLRPGLRGLEFASRRWRRRRARKRQRSSLLARRSRRHISKRRRRREIVPNRLRHKQPLSQLNQSIHSLIPPPISHINQISKIRDRIVESRIAQLLEQAALQLDGDLLQGDDGDGVAALEGFAEALQAALLLALDVGGRLVDGLFEQARGGSGALLRALELDFLDDGAAVTVGGDDGCYAGLGGEVEVSWVDVWLYVILYWDGI